MVESGLLKSKIMLLRVWNFIQQPRWWLCRRYNFMSGVQPAFSQKYILGYILLYSIIAILFLRSFRSMIERTIERTNAHQKFIYAVADDSVAAVAAAAAALMIFTLNFSSSGNRCKSNDGVHTPWMDGVSVYTGLVNFVILRPLLLYNLFSAASIGFFQWASCSSSSSSPLLFTAAGLAVGTTPLLLRQI